MGSKCKFYELDLEAQKKAEEMDAWLPDGSRQKKPLISTTWKHRQKKMIPFQTVGLSVNFSNPAKVIRANMYIIAAPMETNILSMLTLLNRKSFN